MELVWMNYVWLDPAGHRYVGNLNGAASWSQYGAMLCSTQIWKFSLRWKIVGKEGKILLKEFFSLSWRLAKDQCNGVEYESVSVVSKLDCIGGT